MYYPIFLVWKTQGNLKCASDVISSRIYTSLTITLPYCSVRCDRAMNRWMKENSHLDCCLSCKLLKFWRGSGLHDRWKLLSVRGSRESIVMFSQKSLGCHCCILLPGGHCSLRLKMFCPGFANACWKNSCDADCSGSCMPVVFFIQGKQNLKEQFALAGYNLRLVIEVTFVLVFRLFHFVDIYLLMLLCKLKEVISECSKIVFE